MPIDPRIDQLKTLLEEMSLADIAEDADYEARIATVTAELVVMKDARDALQNTINGAIADLTTAETNIVSALAAIRARVTALGG